ncbi:MAG: carboxylating nicotinate-nucleotide diphosphorylase [Acidobacteriota bacterium]
MTQPAFPTDDARAVVVRALEEDLGRGGDLTTRSVLASSTRARAALVARQETVLAGIALLKIVMDEVTRRVGGHVEVDEQARDGDRLMAGSLAATLEGNAWPILAGERVLLNLIARLCGVASLTAACVNEVAGTACRIADTRKTTPGLRALEKYAVAVAGGENHRARLDALILVKDNHKELAGGIVNVLSALRASEISLPDVEIEVDTLEEFDQVVAAGVGWILLDNMSLEQVREAVRRNQGRARLEVSGGLVPGRLRPLAEAGVDRLSLGKLTHGAQAVDLALDIAPR